MHVQGYAFAGPEQEEDHKAAWEKVKHIEDAILSKIPGYNHLNIKLDPEKTKGLTALEKLVLADQMPSPFGGVVSGNTVIVYTD